MSAPPKPPAWWSDADQAELSLLVDALVDSFWQHRHDAGPEYLRALGEALDVILAWQHRRRLRSTAAHLRARQDLDEWSSP